MFPLYASMEKQSSCTWLLWYKVINKHVLECAQNYLDELKDLNRAKQCKVMFGQVQDYKLEWNTLESILLILLEVVPIKILLKVTSCFMKFAVSEISRNSNAVWKCQVFLFLRELWEWDQ